MTNPKGKKTHGVQMNSVVRALTLLNVLKETLTGNTSCRRMRF